MLNVDVPSVAEIETEAARRGLSTARMCRLADVDGTTLWRWKERGSIPTVTTLQRIVAALLAQPVLVCEVCDSIPECLRQRRCAQGNPLPAPETGDARRTHDAVKAA